MNLTVQKLEDTFYKYNRSERKGYKLRRLRLRQGKQFISMKNLKENNIKEITLKFSQGCKPQEIKRKIVNLELQGFIITNKGEFNGK